ncbi:MAG: aldehyde ferredoxin oxidoreductase N-terminal domain-containing protein, partial [Dehalococcoidia bacterium]|nr:aldehyde ferredoxin oxidoreductase N-terminal domain-containing protein [Dehalococcoidia bacterium]
MKMYGWTGRILRVDLTTGKIEETPTSDYVPKFIGGRGVAAMIYWEEVPPECRAFDPENALIMMTGPANGTLSPSASRFTVAHKSPVPLHETYTYSVPGGHWSAELKFAGYDGLVVRGKSAKPVYLWIDDGKVELRSAELLWGMTLSQLTLAVEKLHGWQARVLGIGPAGENLCRQAPAIV